MPLISIATDKSSRLTKNFALSDEGSLVKLAGEHVIDGSIRTVDVTAKQLALEVIPSLTQNECLILGSLSDFSNPAPLKCSKNAGPGEATRSKQYLDFRTYENFLLLDFDDTPHTPEEALDILATVDPQFSDCSCAVVPSSSAYVFNGKEQVLGSKNFHLYVEINGNPAEYGAQLFDRMVLAGHGFPFVTKAGTVVIKTIFDKSVLSPEREIFAANPVMEPPLRSERLEHIAYQEGKPIRDKGHLALNPEEEILLRTVNKDLRESAAFESQTKRKEHNEKRARFRAKISGTNYLHELSNINDAETIYDRKGRPIVELKSDEWIFDEDGKQFQIRDLLINPEDGKRLPDPHEPYMRGDEKRGIVGKGIATVLGNIIYSHNHAGIIYVMRWSYDDLGEVLRTSDNDTRGFIWKSIAAGKQEISASTDEAQISELAEEVKVNLQNVKGSGVGKDKKYIVAKLKPPLPPKDAEDDVLLEFNKKYAMVDIGGKASIVYERWSEAGEVYEIVHSQPAYMETMFKNKTVKVPGVVGGKLSWYKYWEQHPERNEFMEGADFLPNSHTFRKKGDSRIIQQKGDVYNMFQGYILDKSKATTCEKIIDHIKTIWCSGNPVEYEYALAWMARMVQKPAEVSTTALVLQSVPGAGKGVICDGIFTETFGIHAISTANQEDITGRFNAHLGMNLFLYANEMAYTAQASVRSLLKTLLSDKHRMVEAKNVNKIKAKNYTSVIFSSNDSWLLNIEAGDRRYVYLTVSSTRAGDRKYFEELVHEIKNGGREAFILWLLNYDYSGIDLTKIPETDQSQRRIDFLRSAQPVVRFIYALADVDNGVNLYATHPLYSRLRDWQNGTSKELILDKAQLFDVYARYCEYFQVNRQYDDISTIITHLEAGAILAKPNATNKDRFAMTTRLKDGKNVMVLKSIKECKELLRL